MKAAVLTLAAALLLLASCQTAPGTLSAGDSAEIYFQRAQAASDLNQYDEALGIYRLFLTNRPDATHEESFSARYEIALLQDKQGLTADAIAGFSTLVADYDDLEKSTGAPSWVKVLSQKKLQELKDKAPKTKP